MTVGIAAITRENYIVTASDLMVCGALSSLDSSTVKVEEFHKDWATMMSADDLTQCVPIIDRAKENFEGRANSLRVARACFKRAYQQHVSERAADKVLGRFSLDMKTFTTSGKRRFTERTYDSLCAEIREIKGDCQFLPYGFDSQKKPHIFIVNDPGTDEVHDKPGFCAIGSGKYAAEGMLLNLGQTIDSDVNRSIFNVCAAKFMAEKVAGVGRGTFLFVKKQGCHAFSADKGLVDTIRRSWEEHGQPRAPDGIVDQINSANLNFF